VRKMFGQAGAAGGAYSNRLAFFAAIVFALHPVQSESVAWISGSVNALAAVLSLASIYAYLLHKESTSPSDRSVIKTALTLSAPAVLYGMALLAKESVLFVPLLLAGHELFVINGGAGNSGSAATSRARSRSWQSLLSLGPFALVAMGYFLVRLKILGVIGGDGGPWGHPQGLLQTARAFLTVPSLLVKYGKFILVPRGLSVNYSFDRVNAPTLGAFWIPIGILATVGLLLGVCCVKSRVARAGALW